MTLESLNSSIYHDPDGIQTSFIYDFRVDEADHMVVYADGALYFQPFTMTGLGEALGGTVDFITPPEGGIDVLALLRILPLIQGSHYPPYDPFPAESHELTVDEITMMIQQLEEEIGRGLTIPPGYPPGGLLPDPAPGYTLVWNEYGTGFDNAPGEESFLSWVERSETGAIESEAARDASQAARDISIYWSEFAHLWAVEEEFVLVDDGIHEPDYSAYHWAQQAEEGGILDIFSEDTQMLSVNIPEPRYRTLELIHGTPGGMVKLDDQGWVPLENMPFQGSLRFMAPIEGHNRCPKHEYLKPDETPCVEPDTRNPSERVPSQVWLSGDWFVVVQSDEEPLLNQMNLINPDTQAYEITDINNSDAIVYLDGSEGITLAGWYVLANFVSGDEVMAEDVIFDDSMTDIKGINVQLWNQAADAVIDDKVDQAGDLMTGNLDFMNNIGVRCYLNDAVTLANTLRISSVNNLILGGDVGQDGETRLYNSNNIAIGISGNPGTGGTIEFDRYTMIPNNAELSAYTSGGVTSVPLIKATAADYIYIGGGAGSPGTNIYASNTAAIQLTPTNATFSGGIEIPNNYFLRSQLADASYHNLIGITSSDQLQIGAVLMPLMRLYADWFQFFVGSGADIVLDIGSNLDVEFNSREFTVDATNLVAIDALTSISLTAATTLAITAGTTVNITAGTEFYITAPGSVVINGTNTNIQAAGVNKSLTTASGTHFFAPTSHDFGTIGASGTVTVDFASNPHQSQGSTGNTTFVFTNPPAGTHCLMHIINSGNYTFNFPAGISWQGGEAPITPTAHPYMLVSLVYIGSQWFGSWGSFAIV